MYPLNTSKSKAFNTEGTKGTEENQSYIFFLPYPVSSVSSVLRLSIFICNGQRLRGKQRDDLGAGGREHHFLLDARGGHAVGGRAKRLHREYHPGLELVRVLERVHPRDERTLVQA